MFNCEDTYFDTHEYFKLPSGYRIYKKSYFSAKENNIMESFNKYDNDIYIIHGDKDKTVLLEDVQKFCITNNIQLKIFPNAEHGMKDCLNEVNNELIKFLI